MLKRVFIRPTHRHKREATSSFGISVATGDVNGDGYAGSIQARPTEFCLWSDRPNGVGGFRLYVSVRQ